MTNNPFLVTPLTSEHVRTMDMALLNHWMAYCTKYADDPICGASMDVIKAEIKQRFSA